MVIGCLVAYHSSRVFMVDSSGKRLDQTDISHIMGASQNYGVDRIVDLKKHDVVLLVHLTRMVSLLQVVKDRLMYRSGFTFFVDNNLGTFIYDVTPLTSSNKFFVSTHKGYVAVQLNFEHKVLF